MSFQTLSVSFNSPGWVFASTETYRVCISQGSTPMQNSGTVVPPTVFNGYNDHFQGLAFTGGSVTLLPAGGGAYCGFFRGTNSSTVTISCGHFSATAGSFTISLQFVS